MLYCRLLRPFEKGRQWLGWRDSNARNDGVKVRCLTLGYSPMIKGPQDSSLPAILRHVLSYGVEDGTRTHGLQIHNLAL